MARQVSKLCLRLPLGNIQHLSTVTQRKEEQVLKVTHFFGILAVTSVCTKFCTLQSPTEGNTRKADSQTSPLLFLSTDTSLGRVKGVKIPYHNMFCDSSGYDQNS